MQRQTRNELQLQSDKTKSKRNSYQTASRCRYALVNASKGIANLLPCAKQSLLRTCSHLIQRQLPKRLAQQRPIHSKPRLKPRKARLGTRDEGRESHSMQWTHVKTRLFRRHTHPLDTVARHRPVRIRIQQTQCIHIHPQLDKRLCQRSTLLLDGGVHGRVDSSLHDVVRDDDDHGDARRARAIIMLDTIAVAPRSTSSSLSPSPSPSRDAPPGRMATTMHPTTRARTHTHATRTNTQSSLSQHQQRARTLASSPRSTLLSSSSSSRDEQRCRLASSSPSTSRTHAQEHASPPPVRLTVVAHVQRTFRLRAARVVVDDDDEGDDDEDMASSERELVQSLLARTFVAQLLFAARGSVSSSACRLPLTMSDDREVALAAYRRAVLTHREVQARLKAQREELTRLRKAYDKSEDGAFAMRR